MAGAGYTEIRLAEGLGSKSVWSDQDSPGHSLSLISDSGPHIPPLPPAVPSLLEPTGLALQAQLEASGFRLRPRAPVTWVLVGVDGLCVDCVYQK